MSEWKEIMTMKNGKLIMDNYQNKFEAQLKEEARLNVLIAENLGKVKVNE